MKITGKTKIVGLFGYPIAHSLSPILHNAAFDQLRLDLIYIPFLVRPGELKKAVEAVRSLDIIGVNITIPLKEKVLPYLDELSPEARMMGVVNTIHNEDGKLTGYNTDGEGFIRSLTQEGGFDPRGKKTLILGAGGSAYAISFSLIRAGVKRLTIINRTNERAKALLAHLRKLFKDKCELSLLDFSRRSSPEVVGKMDLFINATAVGMHPDDPLLIDPALFARATFIYDVVYNRETELLRAARKRGLSSMGGVGMLIHQGALSFEIWTHRKPPIGAMRRAVEEACCDI